jgi:hypothetical protein
MGVRIHPQQFIQLCMKSQRVSAIRTLDKQGHYPDRQCGDGIPLEGGLAEVKPKERIRDPPHQRRRGCPVACPTRVVQCYLTVAISNQSKKMEARLSPDLRVNYFCCWLLA